MGSRQSARFGAESTHPFVARDRVRETCGVSLKPNPVDTIDGAIDELLAAHDPSTTPHLEFRGARYDAGLAWVHFPMGFGWTNRGYEYPLMWGLIMFAIALRGGGPYSLDRRIGKEL